jgi:hypothetical protein
VALTVNNPCTLMQAIPERNSLCSHVELRLSVGSFQNELLLVAAHRITRTKSKVRPSCCLTMLTNFLPARLSVGLVAMQGAMCLRIHRSMVAVTCYQPRFLLRHDLAGQMADDDPPHDALCLCE